MTEPHPYDQAPQPIPALPVDDAALDAIEHALASGLTYTAADGSRLAEPRLVGADYDLGQLLDFYAGNAPDPSDEPDWHLAEDVIIDDTDRPAFHPKQLIGALVAEVRRLRALVPDEAAGR